MHRRSRGQREYRALIGSAPDESLAELRLRSPRLYEAVIEAFGGPLAGAELERAARELATVAVLAASGGRSASSRYTRGPPSGPASRPRSC